MNLRKLALGLAILTSMPVCAATTVWAATEAGPHKSIDSGATWQNVPVNVDNPLLRGSDPQTPNVFALALDPQQPSTVYFAGKNAGSSGIGFYRSTDNGKTWTSTVLIGIPLTAPISFWTTWIYVDPVLTNVIYLGWQGGVLRSTDYGATFTKLTLPINPNSGGNAAVPDGFSVDPNTGTLYLSHLLYVSRSSDFGDTWSAPVTVDTTASSLRLGPVLVDPKDSNVLYVGNSGGGSPFCGPANARQICGLWRSADGGTSWKNVTPAGEYNEVVFDARTSDLYVSGTVVGLGGSVLKSSDNGNTWNPVSNKTADHLVADPGTSGTLYGFSFNSNATVKSIDGAATFNTTNYVVITGNLRDVHLLVVPSRLGNVSAASFRSGPVTAESIVTALGFNLATGTQPNTSDPVPTNLLGTTVTVIDSTGTARLAPLFYVSPGQVNYEIPAGTAAGIAKVIVRAGDGFETSAPLGITAVTPGVFELNGAHLAAAYALRVRGGNQTYENVYQVDSSNAVVPNPIDLGPEGDQVYLLLFGTGIRGARDVHVTVRGENVPVLSAGAQGQFIGEDQVNIGPLPRSLAGRGNVELVLTADGKTANSTNVTIK